MSQKINKEDVLQAIDVLKQIVEKMSDEEDDNEKLKKCSNCISFNEEKSFCELIQKKTEPDNNDCKSIILRDCRTCRYGYVNEHFGYPMCHISWNEDCIDFSKWERKEE